MTGIAQSIVGMPGGQRLLLKNIVSSLGLSTGLVLCLDAGDSASYGGSGQNWNDASGNSNNFFFGANSASASDDPTFTGTAGSPVDTTYMSFDGGDCFSDNNSLSFADNWHNASANWTFMIGLYPATTTLYYALFTNDTYNAGIDRMVIYGNNGNTQKLAMWTNTHGEVATTNSYVNNSWNILSCTYQASANTMTFVTNGTAQSIGVAANAAGADLSNQPYFLCSSNSGFNSVPNGTRVAFVLAWNTALSTANQQLLRTRIKQLRLPNAV